MARQKKVLKTLKLVFPTKHKRTPVLFRLATDFGIEFNILEGRFSEDSAWVIANFSGPDANIKEALDFLKSNSIEVSEISNKKSK
jgi:ABC-type methionine transport system ATPase subunit